MMKTIRSERILKAYAKNINSKAVSIKVDELGLYDIMDENGTNLKSGDLAKYARDDIRKGYGK